MKSFFLLAILASCHLVATRTLSNEEGHAFLSLYNTTDMQELMNIENNPQEHWHKRKHALLEGPERAMTHKEFCEKRVQDAQEYLAQKYAQSQDKPWFVENDEAIDDILTEFINEEHFCFPHARVTLYALACDYSYNPEKAPFHLNDLSRLKNFSEFAINRWSPISDVCNKKMLWTVSPKGFFAMFDSLVVQSEGFNLGSAASSIPAWCASGSHGGIFFGAYKALYHDCEAHTYRQNLWGKALQQYGISEQDICNACNNPEALAANNIVTLSQQVQGRFYHFHEIPSLSYKPQELPCHRLLFPQESLLTDPGFLDITPYFADVPITHDWRKNPLPKAQWTDPRTTTHAKLLHWSDVYTNRALREELYKKAQKAPSCTHSYDPHTKASGRS